VPPLVFSTVVGLQGKHFAHVEAVSTQMGSLTAKQLIEDVPMHYRIGALSEEAGPHISANLSNSSPYPVSQLGNLNTTSSRSLTITQDGAATSKELGTGVVKTVDLSSLKSLRLCVDPWSYSSLSNVQVTLLPTFASSKYFIRVSYAWYAASENAPTGEATALMYPNSGYIVLASSVPGGYWPSISLPCPLDRDLISSVLKPTPPLGGPPCLALVVFVDPLPGQIFVPAEVVFKLVFTLTVTIGQ